MPVLIQNFRCAQMPELKIIGVSSTTQASVKYLVLASQVIGFSTGKSSRSALSVLHNFIQSTPAMSQGGDLATAFQKGETNAMIYTHHIHNGVHPSYFFTIEGVEETLRSLPNQLEDAHQRFRELFDAFRTSASSTFNLDTANEGQPAEYDDDLNEGRDLDIVPKIVDREWCYRFALQSEREKSELKLQVKDAELEIVKTKYDANKKVSTAELKAKDAEMEKERAKHEADRMRWEMEKLQSKMSRVRENRRPESGKDRHDTESDEEGVPTGPVARKSDRPRKLKAKLSHFAQMRVVGWNNDLPGVNFFADLPDDVDAPEVCGELPTFPVGDLIARLVNGPSDECPDNKQFVMALHYKGRRASKQALLDSIIVKEAYGVEADGVQYLCLVLYKNNGRRMSTVANAFYDGGIVPRNAMPERILDPRTGGVHHISVFKVAGLTDDPVLTMLKKPNYTKWRWFNTKWGK